MGARRWLVVSLGAVALLGALGFLGVVFGPVVRHRVRQPESVDRERLRSDIAAKRASGQSIAVVTAQELEWQKQEPGVEFVVKGDVTNLDLELETPTGPRRIGTVGGLGSRSLQIKPEPGAHTFVIRMASGSRSVTVPVKPKQLTRVLITLKLVRSESSLRKVVSYYDADVVVEPPHPAGPAR